MKETLAQRIIYQWDVERLTTAEVAERNGMDFDKVAEIIEDWLALNPSAATSNEWSSSIEPVEVKRKEEAAMSVGKDGDNAVITFARGDGTFSSIQLPRDQARLLINLLEVVIQK
ncbi:hypothetical protein UFOVP58_37 [uncultured Caudovirales phage]|uniref:Uncharacterized protein n=1 Tax=uncultured Caudovirales phage TaxID=2100421 RepID=A0A6J5KXB7_9CAUD|nr:hypothetical protein UFOVP58_37 [uncultured Caudovirales phage]